MKHWMWMVGSLSFLAVLSLRTENSRAAKPASCPAPTEAVVLVSPLVTVDGGSVSRSPDSGMFVAGNLSFDVFNLEVTAVAETPLGSMCEATAGRVTTNVIDPFTNQPMALTLEVRP